MSANAPEPSQLRTAVDGDIIHETAQKYGFGAGALKGALQMSHREKGDRMEKAMEEAIRKQADREGIESPV